MALLDDMLEAAARAAGAQWVAVRGDFQTFAQNLLRDSADTATSYAAGSISAEDVTMELQNIATEAELIENFAAQEAKQAAQDAINAAISVLVTAITKVA